MAILTPKSTPANGQVKLLEQYSHYEKMFGRKMTANQRTNLANCINACKDRILFESRGSATQPGDVVGAKVGAIDMITAVVPNIISQDLVGVHPIDNYSSRVNYFAYEYAADKGETRDGDMFNSSINLGKSDPLYVTDMVHNVPITTGENELQGFSPLPFSIKIIDADGKVVGADDGSGNIVAVNSSAAAGTVDYANAILNMTNLGGGLVVNFKYDNVNVPVAHTGAVRMKVQSIPIETSVQTLETVISPISEYALQKEFQNSAESLIDTQVAAEFAHQIDLQIINRLMAVAKKNAGSNPIIWNSDDTGAVNQEAYWQTFLKKINEGRNRIYQDTRKVDANYMVCGTNVLTNLANLRVFKANDRIGYGPYLAGSLPGMNVYASPDLQPNEFMLGYKGQSELDTGLIWAPYLPVTSTDYIPLEGFKNWKGWYSVYGLAEVNPLMYLYGMVV